MLDYEPWPSVLIRCFSIAEGLNTITRRGEIGTSLPVLGLRPIRWPFLRTTNEPNEDNFTVSPRSRQSVISYSTNSTSAADSVPDRPNCSYNHAQKTDLLIHRFAQICACDCSSRHACPVIGELST